MAKKQGKLSKTGSFQKALAAYAGAGGGGGGGDASTLNGNAGTFYLDRVNHTGSQLAATISDFAAAVALLTIDAATLDGSSLAQVLARANHTGTQLAATISDFSTAVNLAIAASSIDNSELAVMPANTVKVRAGSSPNNPADLLIGSGQMLGRLTGQNLKALTPAEVRTLIGVVGTGILVLDIENKAVNYTVDENDSVVLADCSSGAVTISLLEAPSTTGQTWTIKKTDKLAFDLIISTIGGPLIDGQNTITVASTGPTDINTSITVLWDGSNYHVI